MNGWFEHILFHMRAQPEVPAMVMEDRAVTYGMLNVAIERCARRIAALNIVGDAPVAVMVKNPVRNVTLSLALFRVGLRSISLAPGQPVAGNLTFATVLADTEAVRSAPIGSRVVEASDAWFGEDAPTGDALPGPFSGGTQVCRASLTSGSTGSPKLVEHRVSDIGQRVSSFSNRDVGRVLCMPGLSSSFGFTTACMALVKARTLCFAESPFQAVRMIDLFSIDAAVTSPEQLLALARVARTSKAQLRSLRTVWVAGGIVTRALLESAAVYVCRDIICRYGASETGVMADAGLQEVLHDIGFAGHAAPGMEIGIFDGDGGRCADGETGLISARQSGDKNWIALGDIGRSTSDGRLYVLGRASDANIGDSQGAQVSPVHEAEHLLRLEWDVADTAAVLLSDDASQLQIWIGVVGNEDVRSDALVTLLRVRGIEYPVRLFNLKSIPRGANGKVNRAQLKSLMLAVASKSVG